MIVLSLLPTSILVCLFVFLQERLRSLVVLIYVTYSESLQFVCFVLSLLWRKFFGILDNFCLVN